MNDELLTGADAAARQRKGRLMMLAIVAVFVVPFLVLPLLMSPEKMGKTNKGTLITPHVVFSALQASDPGHHPLDTPPQKKWALLYIWPSACDDAACETARTHALFALQHVPLALGRDRDRVQSLVLLTAEPAVDITAMLQQDYQELIPLHAVPENIDHAFANSLPGKASEAGNIYLMSPDGYIFMYYAPETDEKRSLARADDVRSDLKKSLMGSRI